MNRPRQPSETFTSYRQSQNRLALAKKLRARLGPDWVKHKRRGDDLKASYEARQQALFQTGAAK